MSETAADIRPANFIAGEWVPSRGGDVYERHNPWRPSEVIGEFPSSSAEDADAAIAAAQRALPEWSSLPGAARGVTTGRSVPFHRRQSDPDAARSWSA